MSSAVISVFVSELRVLLTSGQLGCVSVCLLVCLCLRVAGCGGGVLKAHFRPKVKVHSFFLTCVSVYLQTVLV